MRQTITAVIPAKNEEINIERCIQSVLWCDKIIVMWMGTDRTGEIAKKMGAEVIVKNTKKESDFVAVQENINWAIDNCQTDWILRLDADEVVTKELQEEIKTVILEGEKRPIGSRDSIASLQNDKNFIAYRIPRKHFIFGGFLKGGDWSYDKLVRLFRPQFARYEPVVHVHEQFNVKGEIGTLKHALEHYSHPSLEVALKKFDTYTDVEIEDMHESKWQALFNFIIQPPYIFLRWMIWHKGYIDGLRGIGAATLRSWYAVMLYWKYLKKMLS